jgi:hypothetical protein
MYRPGNLSSKTGTTFKDLIVWTTVKTFTNGLTQWHQDTKMASHSGTKTHKWPHTVTQMASHSGTKTHRYESFTETSQQTNVHSHVMIFKQEQGKWNRNTRNSQSH